MENQRHYLPILFNCVNHEKLKEAGYELIVTEFKEWSEKQIVIKDTFTKDKFYFINQGKKLDRKENSQVVDLISLYENISLFEQYVYEQTKMLDIYKKYYKIIYKEKDIFIDFGHVIYDDKAFKGIYYDSVATFNLTSLWDNYGDERITPKLYDFFSFFNLREQNIYFYLWNSEYIDDITGERFNKKFIIFNVYKDEMRKELLHKIQFQIF